MTPFKIGNATLYHGDALKVLPSLDPVDLIVCDPPYKLTTGGCHPTTPGAKRMQGCFKESAYNNNGDIVECDIDWTDFMPLCYAVLKDPGHAYFMTNNRHIANCENAATAASFHLHNWLVWDKVSATPNRWYMKNLEFCGFFSKGNAFYINDLSAKQLIRCPQVDVSGLFAEPDDNGEKNDHPTEKPVALMRHYIDNSSQRGQLVLDPFMGSGSTGVAAIQAGRSFIGIEKNEKFFNMAVQRITAAVESFVPSMF